MRLRTLEMIVLVQHLGAGAILGLCLGEAMARGWPELAAAIFFACIINLLIGGKRFRSIFRKMRYELFREHIAHLIRELGELEAMVEHPTDYRQRKAAEQMLRYVRPHVAWWVERYEREIAEDHLEDLEKSSSRS
jgi:hypothetical protein